MQFITDGPDIPDSLLQAHEEGRVIFFCGAGISYPAGLPGFEGLVKAIYQRIGADRTAIEEQAFSRGQYDATLDLLERRIPGTRTAVRREMAKVLKSKVSKKGATATHEALLKLSRNREGLTKLVTTNFDRVFHSAASRLRHTFHSYAAPMLPVPKNSRWDGLVFLHGLMPSDANETELNRLVVTSGDFGLAYLTERWAARFVSELFRNYEVCFVGYSLNDPVLRYMMDALAADRMLGEVTPQAWAFGDCAPGDEAVKTVEWEAKGVKPILYKVPTGSNDHSALHSTLHVWGNTYRDGVQGKEAIVVKHALARPQDSTQQDDFVGRMLWSLSDMSGLPAKRFANFNPVPTLDWLFEAFGEERFGHVDLSRFGVTPCLEVENSLRFSLTCRPAHYLKAPWMRLVSDGPLSSNWDEVMNNLGCWLLRHLNDPRLILWIAAHGGVLHERWKWLIEMELDRHSILERTGKTEELNGIHSHAPNAIPCPLMRALWRVVLSGRVKQRGLNSSFHRWFTQLKHEPLTPTMRLELRQLLSAKVILQAPFEGHSGEVTRMSQLVDVKLALAADHISSYLTDSAWKDILSESFSELLDDFQIALRDALDLLSELGQANKHSDLSYLSLPSITPHWQNRGYHEWVVLIELLRDAWLQIHEQNSEQATRIAQSWFALPYPTFKRLALFAASYRDGPASELWVEWLLANDARWLWSVETRREVCRLLVQQGQQLVGNEQERLEAGILAGPPRNMYRDDMEPDSWLHLAARNTWLLLAKLKSSGCILGIAADTRLSELSADHPDWKLAENERDEFSRWMSGTGDPDFEDDREVISVPLNRQELVQWLSQEGGTEMRFYQDSWKEACQSHFVICFGALSDLAKEKVWPAEWWRVALQAWSDEGDVKRSWAKAAPLVLSMPDNVFMVNIFAVARWLEVTSKSETRHERIFIALCRRVMDTPLDADAGARFIRDGVEIDDPVTSAINHPIGVIAQALIHRWFLTNPNDNDLLPTALMPLLTQLCDVQIERYRHGRVILASSMIALFRVDRLWCEQHLLPLFNWNNPVEARAVWEGFLWSPRLYPPLLTAMKRDLLECAQHYDQLGEHRQQYAAFLTYAALEPTDGYSMPDFRAAIRSLPPAGLEEVAQALSQALESAGEQCEEYWRNRVWPFWRDAWPKVLGLSNPRISECLARLAISARREFPSALEAVHNWLQHIEHAHYILNLLNESGLCSSCPREALKLLDMIIDNPAYLLGDELRTCLMDIGKANPVLKDEWSFRRLDELVRKLAGWV